MKRASDYQTVSIYAFAFFLGALSIFFGSDNAQIGLFLLVCSFILVTMWVIKNILRNGFLSPLFIFVFMSFIAYPVMMLYFFSEPSKIFFVDMPIMFEYPIYEDFYFALLYGFSSVR